MKLVDNVMRGDYLFYRGSMNAFPFKVEQVTKKKFGYHAEPDDSRMLYLNACECQPIELTPKILERIGFKQDDYGWYWLRDRDDADHDYINIVFRRGQDAPKSVELYLIKVSAGTFYNIHYLHELQHIFKLCGIDKEIEF